MKSKLAEKLVGQIDDIHKTPFLKFQELIHFIVEAESVIYPQQSIFFLS